MIVEAAIPLLLEHGEMVTTRQVAEAAGIAEGTVFRAFADKDDLLAAVIDAALDTAPLERALEMIDPASSLDVIVEEAAAAMQRRVVEIWRLASSIGVRFHDRAKRPMSDSPALTALLEHHRADLTVTPRAAARNLRAITLAMSHPLLVEHPASTSEIARLYLHGAAKERRPC